MGLFRPTDADRLPERDPSGQNAKDKQRIIHYKQTPAGSTTTEDPQPARDEPTGRRNIQLKSEDLPKTHES
jgi:hypothetical protein